jgi:hypothetical protein
MNGTRYWRTFVSHPSRRPNLQLMSGRRGTKIVQSYSGRDLRYHTDKLPAISGAATMIYIQIGDRYFAGHWENPPRNQCWCSELRNGLKCTPAHDVAPSWSSASITQAITYRSSLFRERFIPSVAVAEVHCDVPGLDPLGKVSIGCVLLIGKVI